MRSAIICAVSKSGFDRSSVKTHTLAGGGLTPQLVKISGSCFLTLWNSDSSLISDELNHVFPDASGGSSPFTAAPNGIYCHNTVLWALESGVTADVGGTFVPSWVSPRADIMTYLCRSLAQ